MSKNKQEIINILQKNDFSESQIEEIIIKDKKRVIISIAVENINSQQSKIAKAAKNAEKEIAKQLSFEKVTIILAINSGRKPAVGKKAAKETAAKKKSSIITKVKNIFQKNKSSKQDSEVKTAQKSPKSDTAKNKAQKGAGSTRKLKNVKKIIAVASAKGGVGKSTLSANIAITLARIGHKVALVDADIYGPSIANIMNLDDKPVNKDNMIIPHEKYGVKFISVANLIDKKEAGVWRAAMINKILHQLMAQTNWSHDGNDIDVMIVDMPPGTGDIYLSLAQNFDLDGAILVSTPQNLSQIDLVRSIDCFEKLKVKILGLIENMSYFVEKDGEKNYIFGKSDLAKLAKERNIDLIDQIEIVKELGDNGESKAPLSYDQPNHQFSHQIGMICEKVVL